MQSSGNFGRFKNPTVIKIKSLSNARYQTLTLENNREKHSLPFHEHNDKVQHIGSGDNTREVDLYIYEI